VHAHGDRRHAERRRPVGGHAAGVRPVDRCLFRSGTDNLSP
jgi:hypothetical protein